MEQVVLNIVRNGIEAMQDVSVSVGKTTFIGAISEIDPLATEAAMTDRSIGIDDRGGALFELLAGILDEGLSAGDAVDRPRLHPVGDLVHLEPGFSDDVAPALAQSVQVDRPVAVERPDIVVLVSSDSDFAPLVLRLREKGCRVCGIGQEGKTGEETRQPYDEYVELPHRTPPLTASAAPGA